MRIFKEIFFREIRFFLSLHLQAYRQNKVVYSCNLLCSYIALLPFI